LLSWANLPRQVTVSHGGHAGTLCDVLAVSRITWRRRSALVQAIRGIRRRPDSLRNVADMHEEPHDPNITSRLNWLRAGVLGANDGIVSVAGIVLGVAGATTSRSAIVTAGIAGLVAGALSMAVGEYVSVSTQRDTERALIAQERRELREMPEEELAELASIYIEKGLTPELASHVAEQLTAHDALAAHADAELHIELDELTNPWTAAVASLVSFICGALLPLLAIALPPTGVRVWITIVSVVVALAITGRTSAQLGDAPVARAVARNVIGGLVAMVITYAIGSLVGRAV
jgi:VIT1/CCC1 family predicted Fe2+/Mn2+ transporter